jgi:hypothetical protein
MRQEGMLLDRLAGSLAVRALRSFRGGGYRVGRHPAFGRSAWSCRTRAVCQK